MTLNHHFDIKKIFKKIFFCNSIMTYGVAKLRNREFRIALISNKKIVYLCDANLKKSMRGVNGSKKL